MKARKLVSDAPAPALGPNDHVLETVHRAAEKDQSGQLPHDGAAFTFRRLRLTTARERSGIDHDFFAVEGDTLTSPTRLMLGEVTNARVTMPGILLSPVCRTATTSGVLSLAKPVRAMKPPPMRPLS